MRTAILSNGSPAMLEALVNAAKLNDVLDAVMSVEEVSVFKPLPNVYQLAADRLGLPGFGYLLSVDIARLVSCGSRSVD